MSHPSFKKWRDISTGNIPSRFESLLVKFRKLQETTTPTRSSKYTQPDRRIDVDTVTTPNILNMAASLDDPREIEKERQEEKARQIAFTKERIETLKEIKKQARRDFSMVGGVAPSGSMSGAGGGDGARPVSYAGRE